jgi:DNA-binding NarL/FixJ family response regulator
MNQGKTRVGIVGNDQLRSLGLAAILEEIPGIDVQQVELAEIYEEHTFELLLLDTRDPLDVILQVLARLRRERPLLRCIVMTMPFTLDEIQSVIGAGAKGFLLESAGVSEIGMAISIVQDGSIWAPRKVMARLVEAGAHVTYVHPPQPVVQRPIEEILTEREREVLHLLMSGRSNREIGAAMGIEQATVKAHLGRMLRKSRATNRVELTLRAMGERATEPEVESRVAKLK